MIKLDIEVTYLSGEKAVYTAALPEWSKWERKTGKSVYALGRQDKGSVLEAFQLSDFLFLAHAGYVRAAGGSPTKPYEIWELTVDGIAIKDTEAPKVSESEASNENAGK